MTGADRHTAIGLPHDRLRRALAEHRIELGTARPPN